MNLFRSSTNRQGRLSLAIFITLCTLVGITGTPKEAHAKDLKVAHHLWVSPTDRRILLKIRRPLSSDFARIDEVWAEYELSSPQGESEYFRAEFVFVEKDGFWRANLGSYGGHTKLTYSIFVQGLSRDGKPKHWTDRGLLRSGHDIDLERAYDTVSPEGKVPFRSAMGTLVSFGNLLNGLLLKFTSVEQQIEATQKHPVRSLKNDAAVTEFLKHHRAYISVTTSPSRISKLLNVIHSLDLTNIEEVLVAVPDVYERDHVGYIVPTELESFPKLKVLHIGKDLGPVSKLVPAIEYVRNKDPESIVITEEKSFKRYVFQLLLVFSPLLHSEIPRAQKTRLPGQKL